MFIIALFLESNQTNKHTKKQGGVINFFSYIPLIVSLGE